jgi:hypothetical protein
MRNKRFYIPQRGKLQVWKPDFCRYLVCFSERIWLKLQSVYQTKFKPMRFSTFLLLLCSQITFSQTPASDHAWIGTGKVSARITSTGIHADSTGGFLLENPVLGMPPLNLLSHLAPWVAGIDPAGNLNLACEMDSPDLSDWSPGIRNVPNSGKVWKVTRAQIDEHIADFQDNGVVDNPIPAIFAWPGRGNPYSMQWNGFDTVFYAEPPYIDFDGNGIYNPDKGDYPVAVIRSAQFSSSQDEIVYAPFFDSEMNDLTNGSPVEMEGYLLAFTFDCNEQDFTQNSIFLAYKFIYTNMYRVDSTFFGMYADFDLGNPDDDYVGCFLPGADKIFCYNSDTLNDLVAGQNPPMMSILPYRGPLDTFGSGIGLSRVMPIFDSNSFPGTRKPQLPYEFYNYITGSWRDGSPLTTGGIGYQTNGAVTNFAFPGHPSEPNEWSEIAEGNPLGDRALVYSYGPIVLKPGAINEVVFALSVADETGPSAQLAQLDYFQFLQDYALRDALTGPLDSLCATPVSTYQPASKAASIFPNPAHSQITLRLDAPDIFDVTVFDVFGKRVLEKRNVASENQQIELPVSNLPDGVYFLQWTDKNGRLGSGKVIVQR